jgi:hypothetical protein
LNSDHLRAFLKRLPDFDDMEAEEKAFGYAHHYPDVHRALAFLMSWPALDKAAKLVATRAAELDGDHYELLTPAAEALQEKYPLASVIMLRAMIDFTLDRTRAGRYKHAARHLGDAGRLSARIEDHGAFQPHEEYVANIRSKHRNKSGFWRLM